MLIWHRVGYIPYLGLTKSSYRRERNHLGVNTVLFFFQWSQRSRSKTFLFFDKCSCVSDQIIIWKYSFSSRRRNWSTCRERKAWSKKENFQKHPPKNYLWAKTKSEVWGKCCYHFTALVVLGFSAPHGPSKTRGSWGESWQNRGRMGQTSACRPDHKIKAEPTARKRWKFIELTDRNLVHEKNSPTKWPSIVHSLTVQSNEAVRRISQFHISTGSMLKSDKQKRTVKRKSSRKGENGSERLTKRLINKK